MANMKYKPLMLNALLGIIGARHGRSWCQALQIADLGWGYWCQARLND